MTEKRHQWASNLGFILAAAGSAVGLGNIWKFPGKVGAYGGGAFLLCYLLIVFLVGFPVMLAELSIGRATQKNVVGAFRTLNPRWRFAGYIGIVTLFVILSYYCVVGGWVLKYVQIYAAGAHFGAGPGAYADYFSTFSARPVEPLLWGLGFLVLCIVVVVRGVSQGIEKVSKVLMPLLFLLLAGLVVYSVTRPAQRRHPGGRIGTGLFFPVRGHGHHGDLRLLRAQVGEPGQKRRLDLRAGHPGSRHGRPGHRPGGDDHPGRGGTGHGRRLRLHQPAHHVCRAARRPLFRHGLLRPALPGRPHQRHQHSGEPGGLSHRGIPPLPGQGGHRPVGAHGAAQRGLLPLPVRRAGHQPALV